MSTSEPEEEQKCGSIDHVFIQEDQIDRRRRNDRDYRRTKGCNRGRNPEIRKEEQKQAWKEKHPDPQSPEWQQRMMDNFLRRPKCHPDCFGAAGNDCGR